MFGALYKWIDCSRYAALGYLSTLDGHVSQPNNHDRYKDWDGCILVRGANNLLANNNDENENGRHDIRRAY